MLKSSKGEIAMTDLEVIQKIKGLLDTTMGITTEELSQVTDDYWQDILHADDVLNQIYDLINNHLNWVE